MIRRSMLLVALAVAIPAGADPIREGAGGRREALNAMELKPFPADAVSSLKAWIGAAPTAETFQGKPVLYVTWSSFYPASIDRGIGVAQRMADKYGAKGLVVIGVHHQNSWDKAAGVVTVRGIKFPVAYDEAGAFRSALMVDQDPDFYVVDRAGQLRYADIETSSVEEAVATVVNESQEDATGLPGKLAQVKADAALAARRTDQIRQNFDVNQIPPVPPGYIPPTEEAYKREGWPKTKDEVRQMLQWDRNRGNEEEEEEELRSVDLSGMPVWYPKAPEMTGRIRIVYVWHPDWPPSYSNLTQWDQLQRQLGRDAVVIGACVPIKNLKRDNSSRDRDEEDFEKLAKRVSEYVTSRRFDHYLTGDFGGTIMGSIGDSAAMPVPGAIVISSDGNIRWVGWAFQGDFRLAIDKALAEDPGVKARREADRQYIESKTK